VCSVALERDAHDERHEHGEDEAVERRPVDRREAQLPRITLNGRR
jgi:hypothetical protein